MNFEGVCYKKRKIINIQDAYKDDRFNGQAYDKKTNFLTKSMVLLPLYETDTNELDEVVDNVDESTRNILGIIQLINKTNDKDKEKKKEKKNKKEEEKTNKNKKSQNNDNNSSDSSTFTQTDIIVMQEMCRILGRTLSHMIHNTEKEANTSITTRNSPSSKKNIKGTYLFICVTIY